ncbi:hypothetical protein KJ969_01595 [Patescibacteria group bacterium]|nr:hypothetical protein [Patescibacteria group bacterium]MBU1921969.1 hypothetical protein [Patescibacteria group bacterium]
MTEVKRKRGEGFEGFLRRFNKRVQQSGKMLQAKKVRYRKDAQSKNKTKESALRRETLKSKREYLIKTGKIKEDLEKAYRRYWG